jgi:hypothetical protein
VFDGVVAAMYAHSFLWISFAANNVGASMYDAFSPELQAPAKCKHGCAAWSTQDASIWSDGKVPADADNKCAHVGSTVNSKYYGAWCFCAQSASVTDDHPLDGMTMGSNTPSTIIFGIYRRPNMSTLVVSIGRHFAITPDGCILSTPSGTSMFALCRCLQFRRECIIHACPNIVRRKRNPQK